MPSRQRTAAQEFRDQRDAERLNAASAAVHRRAGLAAYGQAEVASRYSGYALAALLGDLASGVTELPASVRSEAVRLAQLLIRDDEPPPTKAGISGI